MISARPLLVLLWASVAAVEGVFAWRERRAVGEG